MYVHIYIYIYIYIYYIYIYVCLNIHLNSRYCIDEHRVTSDINKPYQNSSRHLVSFKIYQRYRVSVR